MSTHLAPVSQPASSNEDLASPRDFGELWKKALRRYEQETGDDLLKLPIAKGFPSQPSSADEVMKHITMQNESFKAFRASGKKVLDVLRPIVDVVLLIKECAESASDAVPGGEVIFGVIGVLLKATKGVSELYDSIESLFNKINVYLERVSIHLPKPFTPRTPLAPALMNILVDTLIQVFTALALATKHCNVAFKNEPWFKKVIRVLFRRAKDFFIVLVDQTDVKGVLKKIEELTSAELLAAAAQTNTIVREIQPQVKVIYDEAVVNGLRSWLRPPNPKPANFDKKSKPGSCQWFIDGQQFQEFKAGSNLRDVFWVYGNAGAGKSVLCSSVLDTLRKDTTLLLAYFYLDYSILDKQEGWHGLVSSLLFQIGTGPKACFDYLEQKWKSDHSRDRPSYAELLQMLLDLLLISGPTVLVIDALDELPESTRGDYLFPLLKELRLLDPNKAKLRILFTSRPESDIWKHCMTGPIRFATQVLDLDDAAEHRQELNVYVADQLSRSNLNQWPAIRAKAESILVQKANGMFLWIDLQLPRLKRCISVDDVQETLQELPSGLHATYQRILENMDSSDTLVRRARRVYECVASAKRPLTTAQIVAIFFTNFDTPAKMSIDTSTMNEVRDLEAFIFEKCPGFIHITDTPAYQGWPPRRTVQFIHFSAQEYLMSAELKQATTLVCRYGFDESSANIIMARICLSVLNMNAPPSAIQAYADRYWDEHVSSRNEDALSELLDSFLCMDSPAFLRWAGVRFSSNDPHIDTAFHCAARLGLYRHVQRMLEDSRHDPSTPANTLIKTHNGYGVTALYEAALARHVEVCRVLLEHGALVEDADDDGDTPLHLAADEGYIDVVGLLLQHPAADGSNAAALRCHTRNGQGQTALHKAAYWGRAEICHLLLEHGALVEDADDDGNTPLHTAAAEGQIDIVGLLLQHPAADGPNPAALRCHTRNGQGQTALHTATYFGYPEICRLLLEHGGLVDDEDNDGKTPLRIAKEEYEMDIVDIFLEYGAINESDTE